MTSRVTGAMLISAKEVITVAVEGKFQPAAARRPVSAPVWSLIGLSILAIWIGIVLASIFAPDFISGSQHDHVPLGWIDWIWGLVATSAVVVAATKGMRIAATSLTPWVVLTVGTAVIWLAVALVSAFAPVMVTGTDPTTLPLAAMGAPIIGSFLTGVLCTLVKTAFEPYGT